MECYDFGLRLQEAREMCHLSQSQAAQKLGINRSTISSYERNLKYPSVPKLKKIAHIYKASTDYLLGLEGHFSINLEDIPLEKRQLVVEAVDVLKQIIKRDR